MKRIFVSGPYTQGDVAQNVKRAMDAADKLIALGYAPYVPHLSHFQHMVHPHSYETWMDIAFAWLEKADGLLRLPGESPGADREVTFAFRHDILVFHTIEAVWEGLDESIL